MNRLGNFGFVGFCVIFIQNIKDFANAEPNRAWIKTDADVLNSLRYHRVDLHDVYQNLSCPSGKLSDFPDKESPLYASEMELAAFNAATDFWNKIS